MEIVEEYGASTSSGRYFSCGVTEVFLEERAHVRHQYVELEAAGAVHIKGTLVQQAQSSSYTLTEARVGGGLSRHDLRINQVRVLSPSLGKWEEKA